MFRVLVFTSYYAACVAFQYRVVVLVGVATLHWQLKSSGERQRTTSCRFAGVGGGEGAEGVENKGRRIGVA